MKKQIDHKLFSTVCAALIGSDAKSAIKYIDDKTVVRATWHNKPRANNRMEYMVVSFGAPNYRERAFILLAKNQEEFNAFRKDGWFATVPEAIAGKHDEPLEESGDDSKNDEVAPPTRAELEKKAKEIGIRFDGRTSDEKLFKLITDALEL